MEFEVLLCSRKRILKRHIWRRKEGRQDISLFGACFELYTYLNLKCRWNSLLHFCIRLKLNQKGASTAISRSIAVNAMVTLTTFMPKIAQNCNLTAVIRSIKSMPDTAIINWTMWALWWSISKRDVSAIKIFVVPRSNLKTKCVVNYLRCSDVNVEETGRRKLKLKSCVVLIPGLHSKTFQPGLVNRALR